MSTLAEVFIWDQVAGFVSWDSRKKRAIFEYSDAFLKQQLDIAPVTMPVASFLLHPRMVEGDTDKLYRGLPPMMADSLPDKYGERLFAAWQQRNFPDRKAFNPVERLCYLGNRGLGALEYQPATQAGMNDASVIELNELYQVAQKLFAESGSLSARVDDHQLAELIKVGTSPGGQHPKALIAIHPDTGEVRSGQSEVPEGYEHWLFKFDMDRQFPYGKVEMAYYQIAKKAGIDMADSQLYEEKGRSHFMTKRFDRVGNKKIHLQTLAALNPSAYDYQRIFELMRKLKLPYSQQEQLFRRMVFNVAARNIDDHNKNFSFLMDPNGQWRLSPAYDLLFTYSPGDPSFMNRHEMPVNGKTADIGVSDLIRVAEDNSIQHAKELIGDVVEAVSHWETYAKTLEIKPAIRKAVAEHLLLFKV